MEHSLSEQLDRDRRKRKLEAEYPAIDTAYDLAVKSYDVAQQRADAGEKRIHDMVSLSAVVTFGLLLAANNFSMDTQSAWVYGLMGIFIFDVGGLLYDKCNIVNRGFATIDPQVLFDKHLHLSPIEFKKDMIHHAGEDLALNVKRIIDPRWELAAILTASLVLKVVLFGVWMVSRPSQSDAEVETLEVVGAACSSLPL